MKTELIVALDYSSAEEALALVDKLGTDIEWYKVGKQLFTLEGPSIVRALKAKGKKVFLDLKFHDIPNTVAQAVSSALTVGAEMVNFHASGGSEMMKTTVALNKGKSPDSLLIAVTVLTSMGQETLDEIAVDGTPAEAVLRLASLTKESGVDGVVCSAWEIDAIKEKCGRDFKVVVPGIRPKGASVDDQKRIMTPAEAKAKGADYIVVGRPITKAESPAEAAKAVLAELA